MVYKKKGKKKKRERPFPHINKRENASCRRLVRTEKKKKKKKRIRVDDDDDDDDDDAKKENRREKKKKATQEEGEVPDWKKVLTRFFPSEGRRETTEAL